MCIYMHAGKCVHACCSYIVRMYCIDVLAPCMSPMHGPYKINYDALHAVIVHACTHLLQLLHFSMLYMINLL